ncbi:NAD(P)H-hydrate dehydratase [Parafrankia colletiae]|uniref:Bifunctional NAD(P)H-hydrate repair enzyme n=1 Tax=Parafrankia colletiae TaxID=573497 RepID=A0A1S1QZC5_9ACTN|nr:NAD(P)H-hydrate dehydratase [Parafrankia colletiae]MCK9899372.1 NAD(P)H-hydrate dehydratase [Frankia sp. Cpl3]OHV38879.1 NAD(P)H-hydrate dehydratase [Parafrankia colletiae]
MIEAHTVADVRAAEAPLLAALPPGALMQRAVSGLVTHAVGRLGRVYGARVVVLAGGGDNGGDALWAGARLAARGATVHVLAPGRTHPEATAALLAAGGRLHRTGPGPASGQRIESAQGTDQGLGGDAAADLLDSADLVLDGLLGIGGRGPLREPHVLLARLAPPARTVAVDVPSGVDADTGAVADGAVRASSTVTFGTYKRGLLVGPGSTHTGRVELVDIGLALPTADLRALGSEDVARLLPVPSAADSKYSRGVLGLVGGSDRYPGAGVLAVGGALRGGAGYLRVVAEEQAAAHIRRAHPETVVTVIAPGDADAALAAGRVQAWAIGPGLPPDEATGRLVAALLDQTDTGLLADAGALQPLARLIAARPRLLHDRAGPGSASEVVLTPHEGEFARLVATALGWDAADLPARLATDRLGTVREAAAELGATILLKGDRTIVAGSGGAAFVNLTGTPWLGTAGTGDVLTGLVGSLLAAGLPPALAAAAGAFLHGSAAERGPRPLAAGDLPALLPEVIADLLASVRG